jgi:membrane protease subunit HflK
MEKPAFRFALATIRSRIKPRSAMKNITPPTQWTPPPNLGRYVTLALFAVLASWFVLSGFTSIPADSVGVLTRFGRFVEIVPPGLRFKIPLGVDKIDLVPVQRQLKLEFGFSTPGGTNPNQYPDDPEAERTMLTGDLNMASVEWIVQYRVEDPKQFRFHVFEPEWTLRDAGEAIMREVVGDRTIDEVLTIGRQEMENETLKLLQEAAKKYGLGVTVTQVQLQNVRPPKAVQFSFNEVNQAQQEKQQAINLATGEYNKVVPRARGEALRKISAAEGYAAKRVNEAKGDAGRFTALLEEYVKSPEVMRQRLYLETMQEVLPQISKKVILDDKAGQVFPLLQLDREGRTK